MSEYTPTTQQVRREYVSGRAEAESAIRTLGDDD